MHFPTSTFTLLFAILAGTRIASGIPVPQDADSAEGLGDIVGVAGAATAQAVNGAGLSCPALENKCNSHEGAYANFCVQYCSQCDASDKVDCDAAQAGPVDCVGAGGAKCY